MEGRIFVSNGAKVSLAAPQAAPGMLVDRPFAPLLSSMPKEPAHFAEALRMFRRRGWV